MRRIACLVLLVSLSFPVLPTAAQRRSRPPHNDDPQFGAQRNQDDTFARVQRESLKRMNKERQVKLEHDTEKLLQLAADLKEYVDKSSENTLSLEVIKKCEEIEKLAKNVRERMRGN